MIKILDRYLVREFLIPLCYCLAAFILIYVIYDLSAHLDNYIEDRVPMRFLIQYYVIQMPLVMVQVIPLSILLAIVYCLGALSRHNEITAMRANGISVYRIMLPYFILGVGFTAFIFYLNDRHAPRAYEESKKFLDDARGGKPEEKMRPLAFFNSKEGRAWAGQWKPSGDLLQNVSVRSFQNGQVVETISSSKASYLDQEWWFFDGSIQRYDSKGRARGSEEAFSKRRFPFGEKPEDFLSSQKESLSMSLAELWRNMALYPRDSDIYGKKLVDLHYKIAFPFVGITIVLIAVPLAIKTTRGGAAGSAGLSIAICISYYVVGMVSLSLGHGGHLPAWLASWLPNILFGAAGLVLLYRNR
ncbi:MAG: LptF/LptG family permease [Chlamydiota bacterium]